MLSIKIKTVQLLSLRAFWTWMGLKPGKGDVGCVCGLLESFWYCPEVGLVMGWSEEYPPVSPSGGDASVSLSNNGASWESSEEILALAGRGCIIHDLSLEGFGRWYGRRWGASAKTLTDGGFKYCMPRVCPCGCHTAYILLCELGVSNVQSVWLRSPFQIRVQLSSCPSFEISFLYSSCAWAHGLRLYALSTLGEIVAVLEQNLRSTSLNLNSAYIWKAL